MTQTTEQIERPSHTTLVNIVEISKEIKSIIEKIDFIENIDKRILIDLCEDAVFFSENQRPKLFTMYVAHSFRELTEKFFGESKTVDNESYFVFQPDISEELLKSLDTPDTFPFIERRNGHTIKLKNFVSISERNSLLKLSTDDVWHANVWDLNDHYADNDNTRRDLGTTKFYRNIPAKYSVSSMAYSGLMKIRKALYRDLSAYAHGSEMNQIICILEKSENERSQTDKDFLNRYIKTISSVIDIFRPFELTTSEKIKKIDILLDE